MKINLNRPDTFGALASTLCVVHCLITPLVFFASTCSIRHEYSNIQKWWINLDFLFLLISFVAIYRSTKTTSKKIMKPALWVSWFLLSFLIVNEKMTLLNLSEYFTYIIATALAALHLYNLKYCQCKNDNCCIKKE
jgi:hypothetical protein